MINNVQTLANEASDIFMKYRNVFTVNEILKAHFWLLKVIEYNGESIPGYAPQIQPVEGTKEELITSMYHDLLSLLAKCDAELKNYRGYRINLAKHNVYTYLEEAIGLVSLYRWSMINPSVKENITDTNE